MTELDPDGPVTPIAKVTEKVTKGRILIGEFGKLFKEVGILFGTVSAVAGTMYGFRTPLIDYSCKNGLSLFDFCGESAYVIVSSIRKPHPKQADECSKQMSDERDNLAACTSEKLYIVDSGQNNKSFAPDTCAIVSGPAYPVVVNQVLEQFAKCDIFKGAAQRQAAKD
ncbi:hypothetical protein [Methylosinus sp. RM1]|uniref:hypothetical protein n=1 Tax=Methylosinus sp. RM1 TaxID=2583817 RepID=UPI00140AEAD2|nr:hypothetical protein [Methylosinus sp. RM1]